MALKKLGQILEEHPWRTYVVANLAVILLEKLVEQDFVCPCRRDLAWAIFFLYLMMPLLIGINFGIYLWNSNLWSDLGTDSKTTESQAVCKCSCKCCAIFLTCLVPPVFWLVLFFGDGKYVACLITPIEEDYVDGSNKSLWEWCDKDRARTDKQNYAIYASKITVCTIMLIIFLAALASQCSARWWGKCWGKCWGRCCSSCCCKRSSCIRCCGESGVRCCGGFCDEYSEAYYQVFLDSRLKCVAKHMKSRAKSFNMVGDVPEIKSSKRIADCVLTDGKLCIVAHLENKDCDRIDESQTYIIKNYKLAVQHGQMTMSFRPSTTVFKTSQVQIDCKFAKKCEEAILPPSKEYKKQRNSEEYYTLQGNIILSTTQMKQTKDGPLPVQEISLQCAEKAFEVSLWGEAALKKLEPSDSWKITHLHLKPKESGHFKSTAYTTFEYNNPYDTVIIFMFHDLFVLHLLPQP
ncbi:hypothetical protein NFI96_025605 [Prochilodus magdalenae]|nr:hypothetical protein NFI96_025605 [Prochilodus magdalenae]